MKKLIWIINFALFLFRNGALKAFYRNFKKERKNRPIWRFCKRRAEDPDIIGAAFLWRNTSEGSDYWWDVEKKWKKKIKNGKN